LSSNAFNGNTTLPVFMAAAIALSHPPAPVHDPTTTVVIEEDSVGPDGQPLWSRREMGNRICGEGNSERVAPGYYGETDNDQ
jgi:hypothetical protein